MRAAGVLAAVFFCLLVPTTQLHAAGGEIGLDVGYARLADEKGGDGELASLRGGYHFNHWFELEGQFQQMSPNCDEGTCSDLQVYLINFVFNFNSDPSPRFVPYLLLGVGYTNFDTEPEFVIPGLEDQFKGQAVYATSAGCRIFLGSAKRVALRAEVSATFFEDDQSHNAEVGILWKLGGQK
jgi:hypothetical protein